jgi:hypothetical protein
MWGEDHSDLHIRNTRSTRTDPEPAPDFNSLEELKAGVLIVLSGADFQRLVNFPIIVEAWEHKKAGRRRLAWEEAFTQAERNKIARYHGRFYRWYLMSGTPKHIACLPATLQLLQRAVAFFATA